MRRVKTTESNDIETYSLEKLLFEYMQHLHEYFTWKGNWVLKKGNTTKYYQENKVQIVAISMETVGVMAIFCSIKVRKDQIL